ncbi:hypothetical protein D3C78_1729470 [compost metagenome]
MIGRKPATETITSRLPSPGTIEEPTWFNATSASAAFSSCASQAPRPIIQLPDNEAPMNTAAISFARLVFFGR